MPDYPYVCGCERGGDCTKTTVCAIDSALQDQREAFEDVMLDAAKFLQRKQAGQDANELAVRLYEVLDD